MIISALAVELAKYIRQWDPIGSGGVISHHVNPSRGKLWAVKLVAPLQICRFSRHHRRCHKTGGSPRHHRFTKSWSSMDDDWGYHDETDQLGMVSGASRNFWQELLDVQVNCHVKSADVSRKFSGKPIRCKIEILKSSLLLVKSPFRFIVSP